MEKPEFTTAILRAARSLWIGALVLALVGCQNPVSKESQQDPAQKTPSNNNWPTVSAISNVTIAQDSSTAVDFTIKDLDGPLSCFTSVFVSSTDTELLPVTYWNVSGQAPNCRLQLTPAPGYFGTATVRIEVNDGAHSVYSSFTVTVSEGALSMSVANASANEGNNVVFTVQLSHALNTSKSVNYATANGTAASGVNYTATSGTLVFAAGETSKTVSVPTTHDGIQTANLTFGFSATSPGTTANATGTIMNIDGPPTASAADVSVNEGGTLTFTVNLNHSSASSTTVTYATANGTATAGTNYTAASGTLTFLAGQTSKTVNVTTTDDLIYTPNLTLTFGMTANGITNNATGTINNIETAPVATVSSVSANEGSNLVFTVTLDHASSITTTVTYTTANGTALAGTNYTAASGTLTFTPGQTSKTVTVSSSADSTYSNNLTFTLSATANSTTNNGTGTIVNTDAVPTVAIAANSSSLVEGNNSVFTISLNHASAFTVQVDYATANGTATAGSDYTAKSGTLTISPGSLSATVSVVTADDNADEQDETFSLGISNPSNATLGTNSATVTLQDTALYFNFLGGSLPSGLTFSRSSSATYYDASGVLQTVAAGTPRFDYDPSSCAGSCTLRGLLIEPSRTNLLLQSAAFGTSWTATGVTVTSNSVLSPDGGTNGDTIHSNSFGAGNTTDRISQSVTVAASTSYVLSFFVRNSNSSQSRIELSAPNSGTTGKVVTITWAGAVPTVSAGTATALPDSWYRIEIAFTTNASDAGAATIAFYPANLSADNNREAYLWGAQLEAGATISSYIATGAATATRAADALSINSFSTWFNATAWTAILDFSRADYEASSSTYTPVLFSACDDTNTTTCAADYFQAVHLPSDNTFRGRSSVSSSIVASSNYTNAANLTGTKVQLGVSQTSSGALQTVMNGTAASASAGATKPTLSTFVIGSSGMSGAYSNQLNGHLKKFTYRARALTQVQLQAMTSD